MEISVQPAGFAVNNVDIPGQGGSKEAARKITIVDQTGIQISIVLTLSAYDEFREFLADPETMTARQQARALIQAPAPRMAPPKTRSH